MELPDVVKKESGCSFRCDRRVSPGFRLEAEITGAHILADIPRYLRPPVVLVMGIKGNLILRQE